MVEFAQPADGPFDFRDLPFFDAYRRLAFRLLDDSDLWQWHGVQGVALGRGGVVILLERELPSVQLDHLTRTLDAEAGFREIGPIVPASQGGDRIACGNTPGTLGCLVRDSKGGGIMGLSCDHVIGASAGHGFGAAVLHGGTTIGHFARGTGIGFTTSAANRADAAIFSLASPSSHSSAISGIPGASAGVNRKLAVGDAVKKSGAKTAVTSGHFQYIVTFNLRYPNGKIARFVDQIGVDGGGAIFADRGDSGAVLLDGQDRVAGLVFSVAAHAGLGFANWIDDVETHLGVTVI